MAKTVYSVDSRTARLWFGIAKSNFLGDAPLWQARAHIAAFTEREREARNTRLCISSENPSKKLFAPSHMPASYNESANFVAFQ